MAEPATGFPRETAAGADAPPAADRTFTEGEAYALVADNVARETASLTAKVDQLSSEKASLETEKAELQNKLDIAEAAKATAEQALTDYKAEVENEKAMAARTDERVAKVREVAKHLKDEFFTPERAKRWAAMGDEEFDNYVAELAELSSATDTKTEQNGDAPRETAMAGQQVKGAATKGGGLAAFWGIQKGGN